MGPSSFQWCPVTEQWVIVTTDPLTPIVHHSVIVHEVKQWVLSEHEEKCY